MLIYSRPDNHTPDIIGAGNEPWITRSAINFLKDYLNNKMIAFEWGAGSSTRWLSERVSLLFSVENDKNWFDLVNNDIKDVSNVNLLNINENDSLYYEIISYFPDDYFDFILVDAEHRAKCMIKSVNKLKKGGVLLLDNMERNWYDEGKDYLNNLGWKFQISHTRIISTGWWVKT